MGRKLGSGLEHNLHTVLLDVRIPVPEVSIAVSFLLEFKIWNFKCNGLVGQGCKHDVLIPSIRRFYSLLEGRHDSMSGSYARFDLGEVELKQQGPLSVLWIELFGHPVSWSAELGTLLDRHFANDGGCSFFLFEFERGSLGEVLLVSLSLRVRQVVPFVGVEREAQLAFVRSQVVSHEIGIFGDVDGFERQSPQPFFPVPGFCLCTCGSA